MRNQAVLHGYGAVLDRMTSDDYTFIKLRGEMRTKQEILKAVRIGIHYDSRQIFDLTVRVYVNVVSGCSQRLHLGNIGGKATSEVNMQRWF